MANTLGTYNPFRYRHYVYDEETGLYYLRSRYYNPVWGRFICADGQINSNSTIIALNLFAYCANNPIVYTDENGYDFRVVGAGVQLDGALECGSAEFGGGFEIIVYWDEKITKGKEPVIAVYRYWSGGVGIRSNEAINEAILDIIQPVTDELWDFAVRSQGLSVDETSKLFESFDWKGVFSRLKPSLSISASALLITGNEKFDSVISYSGPFHTATATVWRGKGSYSMSKTCQAYGIGYQFVGAPVLCSLSYSNSNYKLLYVSNVQ